MYLLKGHIAYFIRNTVLRPIFHFLFVIFVAYFTCTPKGVSFKISIILIFDIRIFLLILLNDTKIFGTDQFGDILTQIARSLTNPLANKFRTYNSFPNIATLATRLPQIPPWLWVRPSLGSVFICLSSGSAFPWSCL